MERLVKTWSRLRAALGREAADIALPLPLLLGVSAALHVVVAVLAVNPWHPDEHFQILEPAWARAGLASMDQLPWEFQDRIRPTLQVEGTEHLFAVGDCASLTGMQKAGVYAVRSGPILAENLRRALAGQALRNYEPQQEYLSLLNLGDGTALGIKRGIAFEGRWVMHLKDRIDRRFVERYQ